MRLCQSRDFFTASCPPGTIARRPADYSVTTTMLVLRSLLLLLFLLTGCVSGQQDIRQLTILHTNDLHARFLPDEQGRGGFAYVAAAIQQERAKSKNVLVLHAGDFVQGTPVSTIFRGLPVWEVGNHLGFNVTTLGNHEFDYGWEQILKFLRAVDFPTVAANIVNAQGELLTPKPYVTALKAFRQTAHSIETCPRDIKAKPGPVGNIDRRSVIGCCGNAIDPHHSISGPSGLFLFGFGKLEISLLLESGTTVPISSESAAVALRRSTKPGGTTVSALSRTTSPPRSRDNALLTDPTNPKLIGLVKIVTC